MSAYRLTSVFALAMLPVLACLFFTQDAPAATVKTQPPCAPSPTSCLVFSDTGAIPVIRSFQVTAPRSGTAMVQFHGSVTCENTTAGNGIVILQSQIVDNAAATPTATMPGGLWQGLRLMPQSGLVNGRGAINLASTRSFGIAAAGPKTFYFKIGRVNVTAGVFCSVYNATFSVVFTP